MTEASEAPIRADDAAIRGIIEAIAAGNLAQDAEAIAQYYAPGASIADLAPPLQRRDFDRAGMQAWLDGCGAPVEVATRNLVVEVAGDLAVAHGLQHTRTRTRSGEEAAWWSRVTRVLNRSQAGWRITHEHDSVPFHMDGSFRAAVDLEP